MKQYLMRFVQYIRTHKLLSSILGVIAFVVIGSLLRPAPVPNISTAPVEKTTLIQSVEETGSLETGLEVSYGFETSGRVVSVLKKAGDTVALNDVLVELDGRNERAALSAAQASYAGALADLNKQLAGGSDEDRRSAAAKVDEARAYLAQAEADRDQAALDAQNALDAAQTAVDKAKNNLQLAASGNDSLVVKNAYDDLLNVLYGTLSDIDEASTQVDTVLGYDSVYANDVFESIGSFPASTIQDAIASYKTTKEMMRAFETTLDTASVSKKQEDIDLAATRAQSVVLQMRSTIRSTMFVLDEVRITESSLQSTLDSIVSNIQSTQTAINTSVATLTSARQAVITAKNSVSTYQLAYDQAVRDLATAIKQKETTIKNAQSVVDLRRAGLDAATAAYDKVVNPPREIDLASLRAEVSRRGAEVSARQDAFAKTKLIARTNGIVGKMDIRVGENAVINKDIVTLLSENYLIKVDISESDVTKISLGDPVYLDFDAVPNHTFTGSVVEIDESKTEISGVVYYKTTISLSSEDTLTEQLRSGMTVDVRIETDKKEQVLVIPRRAVVTKDGQSIVRVVTNTEKKTFEERPVTVGISGDNGMVEILDGLQEGQEVVTFVEEKK